MSEPPPERSWDQTGRVRDDATILHEYQDAVVRHVAPGGERPLAGTRIAVDCAHGAGALATPNILSRLGADLILLGGNPDGRFPDHPSEPTEEHLAGIRHVLTQDTCSFGLAHDGDADRTIFLHKDGSVIPQERLFAVLAAARGDRVVALPTDASGVVAQHLPQADIRITPVGDIHLSRAIEEGATFACEPSGTWFMRDWSPTPEGPYAAAYIATLLAKDPDILDQVRALPIQHRRTQKVPFPNGLDRGTVADRIVGMATALAGRLQATTVSDVDGVRIDTADGWVLIRPSGTEPVVRLTSESADQARADTLIETGHHELHRMLEAD